MDEAVDEELSTDQPIQRPRKQTRPKPNTANETSPVDERSIYGPEASNEAIKKAPEIEKKMPVPISKILVTPFCVNTSSCLSYEVSYGL